MTQLKHESEDITSIKSLIAAFFDAVNAADPKALGTLFFENANLVIVRQDPPLAPSASHYPQYQNLPIPEKGDSSPSKDERITVVIRTDIEKFLKMIEDGNKRREGKPGPVLHEEADLSRTDVKVDHLFGMAWSPFKVTFDGVLHHYGSLVYTLGKVENGNGEREWKIEGLTQNYRRTPGWQAPFDAFQG